MSLNQFLKVEMILIDVVKSFSDHQKASYFSPSLESIQ